MIKKFWMIEQLKGLDIDIINTIKLLYSNFICTRCLYRDDLYKLNLCHCCYYYNYHFVGALIEQYDRYDN